MKLRISDSLALPLDAVTQKLAFLGRTGSGKSYGATKLAEEMLEAKAQIVVLDPVGVWWGLRTGTLAVGPKGGGYDIPVFGGLHGDLPLEPGAGALVADLIVERGISAVIDVSQFLVGEQRRFGADFATQLFQRKKASPSPLHFFVEEAQEFIPQKVAGDVARMVGAFERLIKLGRNFGLGATLISQRPQAVNKDVLNQTECLFAFQMTGPQERKAIESWVQDKGADDDIVATLPKLRVGEPHVWSPQWLQISKTIRIAPKNTADVSSTPAVGKRAAVHDLAAVDVDALRALMAATIEKQKAEDPRELRKKIEKMRGEISALSKANAELADKAIETIQAKQVPVLNAEQLAAAATLIGRLTDFFCLADAAAEDAAGAKKLIVEFLAKLQPNAANSPVTSGPGVKSALARTPTPAPARETRALPGELKLSATQQRILDALAWFESIGNFSPTALMVGAIAIIDSTGGHFSNVVGPLSSGGLVVRGAGTLALTEDGRRCARVPERVATLADYHEMLRQRVRRAKSAGGKTVAILDAVIRRGGGEVTTEEIGREVEIDPTGGHFSNTIGPLGTLGLIRRERGVVTPTEIIFPPGLR